LWPVGLSKKLLQVVLTSPKDFVKWVEVFASAEG